MTYYNLDSEQALYWQSHDEMVLVIPLPKQPPKGYYHHNNLSENRAVFITAERPEFAGCIRGIKLPIPIGARVGLCGNWTTVTDMRVCRVQSVTIQEVIASGIKDADKIIVGADKIAAFFKDWFNKRYAHPRPRVKGGKIIGYECWVWDVHSFFGKIWRYGKFENVPTDEWESAGCKERWKGKPLTIHGNPYVAIVTVEKE